MRSRYMIRYINNTHLLALFSTTTSGGIKLDPITFWKADLYWKIVWNAKITQNLTKIGKYILKVLDTYLKKTLPSERHICNGGTFSQFQCLKSP